jgi:anti-anti-sigma factor
LDEERPKGPGSSGESTETLLRRYEAWRPQPGVARGMFDVTTGRDDDMVFIAVSGELDYSNVDQLDKEIRAAEKGDARRIVISLRDVNYMDSSGLNLLLQARVRMRSYPQRLRFLRSEHEAVRQLLDATQTAYALY